VSRRCGWRGALVAALLLGAVALCAPLAAGAAAKPKVVTSLTAVEGSYMCVSCHEPLAVAESPQSDYERTFIQHLVILGDNPTEIKKIMVAQYGSAVLALPPAHGFNLLIYVLPPALVLLAIALLLYTLPRWRARSRAAATVPYTDGQALTDDDSTRLNKDLARFD
jgi:cytochrome c-type biogenesis protein CcmH/NrfF